MTEALQLDFHSYIFAITDRYICENCRTHSMGPRHISFLDKDLADVLIQCGKCGATEYIKIVK
ncbi:hypothetical protein [Halobacillus sp. A5]|uniref:hypothetical protein n=1 Tax=Halobacillus sp. A5 TaxID=2880263 RepID=UPI0020A640C6|nr:hypothetical protein [Halobacillus sp. A5]MCP3026511.1 hypothetical protein [Halobacillus sp. A5]